MVSQLRTRSLLARTELAQHSIFVNQEAIVLLVVAGASQQLGVLVQSGPPQPIVVVARPALSPAIAAVEPQGLLSGTLGQKVRSYTKASGPLLPEQLGSLRLVECRAAHAQHQYSSWEAFEGVAPVLCPCQQQQDFSKAALTYTASTWARQCQQCVGSSRGSAICWLVCCATAPTPSPLFNLQQQVLSLVLSLQMQMARAQHCQASTSTDCKWTRVFVGSGCKWV
jgi:hypothetical protein